MIRDVRLNIYLTNYVGKLHDNLASEINFLRATRYVYHVRKGTTAIVEIRQSSPVGLKLTDVSLKMLHYG